MTIGKISKYIISSVFLYIFQVSVSYAQSDSPEFIYHAPERTCPVGYRMASYDEANNSNRRACNALGTWFIARLYGGGSQDGPGYSCRNRRFDKRPLGHTLCKKIAHPARRCNMSSLAIPHESPNCKIDRTSWEAFGIDRVRRGGVEGKPCGGPALESCWLMDDRDRDHLNMDSRDLNLRTVLKRGSKRLPSNDSKRFIYVYRTFHNDILLRAYDRGSKYSAYQYADNCSNGTKPCSGKYNHVRHSQLNGGWNPVWCAGEMRIERGEVCMINNESGHFKPGSQCPAKVLATLKSWGVNVSSRAGVGAYGNYHAGDSCFAKDEL